MCLNPMHGFVTGVAPTGAKEMFITSPVYDCAEYYGGRWHGAVKGHTNLPPSQVLTDYILIPCGRCHECRLKYSRDWATRMVLEMKEHESSYFVTLTYDEDHVHRTPLFDVETGEYLGDTLTLCKDDLAPFMKRLRRALEYYGKPPIRFYAAGEYGDKTLRPHIHIIVFGLQLDDLQPLRKSRLGNQCWASEFLQKLWPYGQVVVNETSWQACAYVARYVMKKQYGAGADVYKVLGIEPEFAQMSRRPGIGRKWYDEHKHDLYLSDEDKIYLETVTGGMTVQPPAYYDRLFGIEDVDRMEEIKTKRRESADQYNKNVMSQTTLSEEEIQEARRRLIEKRIELLRRNEV